MNGFRAESKAAIKRAIIDGKPMRDNRIQFTDDLFPKPYELPEEGKTITMVVVGPDAYRNRKWYGTITINHKGEIVGVK